MTTRQFIEFGNEVVSGCSLEFYPVLIWQKFQAMFTNESLARKILPNWLHFRGANIKNWVGKHQVLQSDVNCSYDKQGFSQAKFLNHSRITDRTNKCYLPNAGSFYILKHFFLKRKFTLFCWLWYICVSQDRKMINTWALLY